MTYRTEKDFLGEKEVPLEAYWGSHTQGAVENFALSGYRVNSGMVRALALVKKACCQANRELGLTGNRRRGPSLQACDEVAEGAWPTSFPWTRSRAGPARRRT